MKILLCILVGVFSFSVFAKDGSSGCGPGWYVTQKNSLLSSAIRGTTNALLAPSVTLGMTFGTSNCTKHSIVKREKESLKFATENYFELASDTAKGNGDFLNAYAHLMGCNNKVKNQFKSQMQSSYTDLFKSGSTKAEALVEETYKVILNNSILLNNCKILS